MKKKFFSLQYKFFIYFLLLSIIPTVITGIFSYSKSSGIILKKTEEINAQKLNSLTGNIATTMNHVNEVSHLIFQNSDVRNYFEGTSQKDPSEIMSFLTSFVGYNTDLYSIRIEGLDDRRLTIGNARNSHVLTERQREKADSLEGYYYWTPSVLSGPGNSAVRTFSFIRQYRNIYQPSVLLGYIVIDIPVSLIIDTYQNELSSEGNIFLIANQDGTILASNAEKYRDSRISLESLQNEELKKIGKHALNGEYLVNTSFLEEAGWTIIDLTPTSVALADNQVISQIIVTVILCSVFVCVLLSFIISRKNLAPLRTLGNLIKDAGHQHFSEYPYITTNDEVGLLAKEFNEMSQRLEFMMNQVYAAQLSQSEAEFQALQAQINPHFLYNTLDTIYWVCRLEHADEAAELVQALGNMFRLSLNKGEGLITLQNELKHLSSYLIIQKKRCKDNVKVKISVDSRLEPDKVKVIKLILQPLVENAFVHGVSNSRTDNLITITVTRQDQTLLYIIEDNGNGIAPELVTELNSRNSRHGFGIRNTNERIKLLFGEEYGITISSTPGKGTRILVKQPYCLAQENEGGTPNAKTHDC